MNTVDLSFVIQDITAFHLAFTDQPGYWEDYRGGGAAAESARFEFRPGWQTVYPRTVEAILLRVRLADGTVGWGEANTPIGPEVTALVCERLVGPMACGRDFGDPQASWDFLYDAQRGRGYAAGFYLDALAALDIAVWDALGKRADAPVAALLCDTPRQRIPAYLSGLRQATLAARIESMRQWADTGLRGIKIFLDGDLDAGMAELASLQEAGGIEQWMVDTLWMCSYESAELGKLEYGKRNVRFFECPLQPEDLIGHQDLVAKPGAPIALGEHFRSRYQMEAWVQQPRALDVYQPDIGRTGFTDYMNQMDIAARAGILTTPHMGTGVSVFQAATLQCAAVAPPDYLQEFQGGLSDRLEEASNTAWKYADGGFVLPDRPGIGVEINETLLDPFVVKR